MKDILKMNEKERTTIKILERVKLKVIKPIETSKILKLSYRQTNRKYSRYKLERDAGIINKMRGKSSNNRIHNEKRTEIIKIYTIN